MKTISIMQADKACPECGWKPANVKTAESYSDLIDHVKENHASGNPTFIDKTLFVTGHGAQICEVAIFTSD